MKGEQQPDRQVRDYRYYTEDAYHYRPEDEWPTPRLDVNDLVGTRGAQLEPNDDDWEAWRKGQISGIDESQVDPDPNLEPDALPVGSTKSYVEIDDNDHLDFEILEAGAIRILHALAQRLGPGGAKPFQAAIGQMIEPVRTVAVNCLVWGVDHEVLARNLNTSVETIDFLAEVALTYLEPLVTFEQPYVRPRGSTNAYGYLDEVE